MIDLDAIKARADVAMQMVSDLCNGKREWIMRIPAQPDYDPDLVIATSLGDNTKLVTEVERLKDNERTLLAEIAHLRLVKLAAKAHIAEWSEGDTFAHDTRAALKAALESKN